MTATTRKAKPKVTQKVSDRDRQLIESISNLIAITEDSRKTQKQILREQQAKSGFFILTAIWALILAAVIYLSAMTMLDAIANSPAGRFFGLSSSDRQEMVMGADGFAGGDGYYRDDRPIKATSMIGSWRVTSGRGKRVHPISGAVRHHGGVDLVNTQGPTGGHPLIAPWNNAQVSCFYQDGGAGHGANIKGGPGGLELRVFHMRASCTSGTFQFGQKIGEVGSSGGSTGDHLHLERHLDGEQDPTYGDAYTILGLKKGMVGGSSGDHMQRAIALIKHFEGFHPNPYSDYSQCSWGYGTNAGGHPSNCPNITITRERAEQELVGYLNQHCVPLLQELGLNSNQFAALASKCYNLGPGQLRRSRTYLAARRGNLEGAANGFDDPKWMNAGGERLPGLVRRRGTEKKIFQARVR